VSRAIEKLRTFFRRRGVALSATALGGAVVANTAQAAAPPELVAMAAHQSTLPPDEISPDVLELAADVGRTLAFETARQSAAVVAMFVATLALSAVLINFLLTRPPTDWRSPTQARPAEGIGPGATTASSAAPLDAVVPWIRHELYARMRATASAVFVPPEERSAASGKG